MDNITNTQSTTTASSNYALNGKIMLCSVVILFSVISAVIFFHAYSRCCSRRNPNPHRHVIPGTRQPTGVNIISAVRARKLAGLDPSILKTLPTFVFGAGAPAPECVVCLSEFELGERGRKLPKCGHAFHAECIDAWFGSHSSCPLCRSPVEPVVIPAPSLEIVVSEPEASRVGPGSGFHDLVSLGLRDDGVVVMGSSEKRLSLKRIWSI